MRIQRLHVENYRCFDRATIDFDERLTVITGPNGSGKTAVLEALAIFLSLFNILSKKTGILTRSFSNDDLRLGAKVNHIKYALDFDMKSFDCVIKPGYDGILNVLHNDYLGLVEAMADRDEVFPILVYYSSDRTFSGDDGRLVNDDYLVDDKLAFKNNFMPKMDLTSTLKWFKSLDINEAKRVRETRDVDFRETGLQTVKDVVDRVLAGRWRDLGLDASGRELTVRDPRSGARLQFSQLGRGDQSILAMSLDLARRMAQGNASLAGILGSFPASPAIVLIDEIDLHLHPSWQLTVLPSLLGAFPGTQFVVTTHSSLVVGSVGRERVRVIGPGGVARPSPEVPWDDHYRILSQVFGVDAGKPGVRE